MQSRLKPAPRPGLPGFVVASLYAAALAGPLGLAALTGIAPAGRWSEASTAIGMTAAVALMLQFVTSGRFETVSGRVGIDVTMAFHKWTARVLLLAVVLHPLLFVAPTVLADPALGVTRLGAMLAAPRYLTGVVALVLVAIIVVAAINRDRIPVPYEVWRAAHWLMAFAAAALVMLHALRAGTYSDALPLRPFWPVLAAVVVVSAVVVYGIRTLGVRRGTWRVTANRRLANGLYELAITPAGGAGLSFRAGQFAWISVAPRLFPLFDHPFSIASSPAAGPDLRFVVKCAGDFTDRIASLAPGTKVGLDGPHGSFVLDDLDADAVVLVAGGIGIAPILSIIDDLALSKDRRPVRLVYRGSSPARMMAPAEVAARAAGLDFAAIHTARETGGDAAYETARPDRAMLARAMAGLEPKRTAAMICGPGPLMVAAADAFRDLGIALDRIRYERFDYGDETRSAKDRRTVLGFRLMGLAVVAAMATFAFR